MTKVRKLTKAALLARLRERPEDLERIAMMLHEPDGIIVVDAESAYRHVAPSLLGRDTEALVVLCLDRRHRPICCEVLTTGSDQFTVVDPRQIFRRALLAGNSGAAGIILAHNHPSGDPTPSPQDREVTRRVGAAGAALGIPLLDHLVVSSFGGYTSLRSQMDWTQPGATGSWTR